MASAQILFHRFFYRKSFLRRPVEVRKRCINFNSMQLDLLSAGCRHGLSVPCEQN
jgi:hypothetical protein